MQELEFSQQRQQSILGHDVAVMADIAGYEEEKGYNPSDIEAVYKAILETKVAYMQVPRQKTLSQGLPEETDQSQSMVQTVESARSAEEKYGIER